MRIKKGKREPRALKDEHVNLRETEGRDEDQRKENDQNMAQKRLQHREESPIALTSKLEV